MESDTRNSLRDIGLQLDWNQFPHVYNGGVVRPGDAIVVPSILGEDTNNVRSRKRRSEAGSWERSAGRQGAASRPRSAGTTSPVICSGLRERYEAELDEVQVAYPGTRVWKQAEGLWLLTESTLLAGLGKKATFLTALPFTPLVVQKSWAFWTTPVSFEWIGARHTNFPDGSVCAYEPRDGTWVPGGEIVKLLDLYSLWALRHEYLRVFGRWPGHQAVHFAFERLSELKDHEFCGCNSHTKRMYAECCKRKDAARVTFKDTIGLIKREPPEAILRFMRNPKEPPPVLELLKP